MQVIALLDGVFKRAHLPLRLRPFAVLITSGDAGIIETVTDARSVHSVKVSRALKRWEAHDAELCACVHSYVRSKTRAGSNH
jgi:phosphatidylinositol kinase/protein kinase (PI-3  family)